MWYKLAQGFGGGILSPVEVKINGAVYSPVSENPPAQDVSQDSSQADIPQNPMGESTEDYEKRLWDTLVNRSDAVKSDGVATGDGGVDGDGAAVEADEARRLSPYHQNPEETTMEEQLEAVRQQNVNSDEMSNESMSSTESGRGEQRVRGEFPYASGKGWTGYEDLPSDKSWA